MALREAVGTRSALGNIVLDAARGPNVTRYNCQRAGLDRQTFRSSQLPSRRIHSMHRSRSFRSLTSTRGTFWHNGGPVLQRYRRLPSRPGHIVNRRAREGTEGDSYLDEAQNINNRPKCHLQGGNLYAVFDGGEGFNVSLQRRDVVE